MFALASPGSPRPSVQTICSRFFCPEHRNCLEQGDSRHWQPLSAQSMWLPRPSAHPWPALGPLGSN